MEDENIIKLSKLGLGGFLAALYAFTGMNGMIILLAAFLLGLPLEKVIAGRLEK